MFWCLFIFVIISDLFSMDGYVFYFILGVCQWLLAVFAGRSGGVMRCWREFFLWFDVTFDL